MFCVLPLCIITAFCTLCNILHCTIKNVFLYSLSWHLQSVALQCHSILLENLTETERMRERNNSFFQIRIIVVKLIILTFCYPFSTFHHPSQSHLASPALHSVVYWPSDYNERQYLIFVGNFCFNCHRLNSTFHEPFLQRNQIPTFHGRNRQKIRTKNIWFRGPNRRGGKYHVLFI